MSAGRLAEHYDDHDSPDWLRAVSRRAVQSDRPLVERSRGRGGRALPSRALAHVFHDSYRQSTANSGADRAPQSGRAASCSGWRAPRQHRGSNARAQCLSCCPDATVAFRGAATIAAEAAAALAMPAPRTACCGRPLGRRAGPALSRDAGRYLCNYLCWRASEGGGGGWAASRCFRPCAEGGASARQRGQRRATMLADLSRAGVASRVTGPPATFRPECALSERHAHRPPSRRKSSCSRSSPYFCCRSSPAPRSMPPATARAAGATPTGRAPARCRRPATTSRRA